MKLVIAISMLGQLSMAASGANGTGPPTAGQVRTAVDRGIDYLLKDQNKNGGANPTLPPVSPTFTVER